MNGLKMKTGEYFQVTGQMHYLSAKLDFLLANIAIELGVIREYEEFNQENSRDFISRKILENLSYNKIDLELYDNFKRHLSEMLYLHKEKNLIGYGLILNIEDEYLFHQFNKAALKINELKKMYTPLDIYTLNENIMTLHNQIHTLWGSIQNSKRLVRAYSGAGKKPAFSNK